MIHYDPARCRSLTMREAARLQTCLDNCFSVGPRTEQYHHLGKSIRLEFAQQLAEIVAKVVDSIRSNR